MKHSWNYHASLAIIVLFLSGSSCVTKDPNSGGRGEGGPPASNGEEAKHIAQDPKIIQSVDDSSWAKTAASPNSLAKELSELLNEGNLSDADARLKNASAEELDNDVVKIFAVDIHNDPKQRWPEKGFVHEVRPGETLGIIAECYLGSRHRFFALARYNDIAQPKQLKVGSAIQIPAAYQKKACSHRTTCPPRCGPVVNPKPDSPARSQKYNDAKKSLAAGKCDVALRELYEASIIDKNALVKSQINAAIRKLRDNITKTVNPCNKDITLE